MLLNSDSSNGQNSFSNIPSARRLSNRKRFGSFLGYSVKQSNNVSKFYMELNELIITILLIILVLCHQCILILSVQIKLQKRRKIMKKIQHLFLLEIIKVVWIMEK